MSLPSPCCIRCRTNRHLPSHPLRPFSLSRPFLAPPAAAPLPRSTRCRAPSLCLLVVPRPCSAHHRPTISLSFRARPNLAMRRERQGPGQQRKDRRCGRWGPPPRWQASSPRAPLSRLAPVAHLPELGGGGELFHGGTTTVPPLSLPPFRVEHSGLPAAHGDLHLLLLPR